MNPPARPVWCTIHTPKAPSKTFGSLLCIITCFFFWPCQSTEQACSFARLIALFGRFLIMVSRAFISCLQACRVWEAEMLWVSGVWFLVMRRVWLESLPCFCFTSVERSSYIPHTVCSAWNSRRRTYCTCLCLSHTFFSQCVYHLLYSLVISYVRNKTKCLVW